MSHAPQREIRARCLEAMDAVLPLRQVIRFGSHTRGDARPDRGVDLCLVADGSEKQCDTATNWLHAVWDPRPCGRPARCTVKLAPPSRVSVTHTAPSHA